MKRILAGLLALVCCLGLAGCGASPVTKLEASPASLSLVPGVSVRLVAAAYTENGETASQEQLEALGLRWEYQSEDGAFTVDETGLLTPTAPGKGTAWAVSGDGSLQSQAIEVLVKQGQVPEAAG